MKTSIKLLLIAFLFAPMFVIGQSNSKDLISVSVLGFNVLYIGIENYLNIAICDEKAEYISATIEEGEIKKVGKTTWTVRVKNQGNTKLKVFIEKNGVKKLFSEKDFRVMKMPDPLALIAGVSREGEVDKSKLLIEPYLAAFYDGLLIPGVVCKVQSFDFKIIEGDIIKEVSCSSLKLNTEIIRLIENSKSGAKIIFFNIKAIGPDGTHDLEELKLIIK